MNEASGLETTQRRSKAYTAGCLVVLLAILGWVATWVVSNFFSETGEVSTPWKWVSAICTAVITVAFTVGIVSGLKARRGARQVSAAIANNFAPAPIAKTAIAALENCRFPAAVHTPGFPTRIVASALVPTAEATTYVAINVPIIKYQPRGKRTFEPATMYQWTAIGAQLPPLIVGAEMAGQQALLGRDISIENEDFNRRFRIDSAIPSPLRRKPVRHEHFARYATALLHPRAVEILNQLPAASFFVIGGGYVGIIAQANATIDVIQRGAEVLSQFSAAIPRHVLQQWDGSTDYTAGAIGSE